MIDRKILLVEDDALLRKAFKIALARAGLEVVEAATVAEARAVIAAGPVVAVITDMGLADGGGADVLAAVRASASAWAPVVVVAGRASSEREALVAAGFDDFLPKPVKMSELTAACERAFQRSAAK